MIQITQVLITHNKLYSFSTWLWLCYMIGHSKIQKLQMPKSLNLFILICTYTKSDGYLNLSYI